MGEVIALQDMRVRASNVTGQRSKVARAPRGSTVGDWVETLIDRLELKRADRDGNPHVFRVRLEREGRHLNPSEIVGEVIEDGDHVVLQPNVDAG